MRTFRRHLIPSHVCRLLRNLVNLIACDDIKFYPDLVCVTYDDLELVVVGVYSLCRVVMLLMIVMKPCDTSMPKENLIWDDLMVGLGVSHGFMYIMNPFLLR